MTKTKKMAKTLTRKNLDDDLRTKMSGVRSRRKTTSTTREYEDDEL